MDEYIQAYINSTNLTYLILKQKRTQIWEGGGRGVRLGEAEEWGEYNKTTWTLKELIKNKRKQNNHPPSIQGTLDKSQKQLFIEFHKGKMSECVGLLERQN